MTDGYGCYQNALIGQINGALKQKILIYQYTTAAGLKKLVKESVNVCNRLRPYLSPGVKTTDETHKKASCNMQLA